MHNSSPLSCSAVCLLIILFSFFAIIKLFSKLSSKNNSTKNVYKDIKIYIFLCLPLQSAPVYLFAVKTWLVWMKLILCLIPLSWLFPFNLFKAEIDCVSKFSVFLTPLTTLSMLRFAMCLP